MKKIRTNLCGIWMTKKCSKCHRSNTLVYNGREYWYYDKDGNVLCRWCYLNLIANPKRNFKTMKFKGKSIVFPFKLRIGQCFMIGCTGTNTDRHHIEYIPCFPIAMTVELCGTHHQEENRKQEKEQHSYFFDWNLTIVKV